MGGRNCIDLSVGIGIDTWFLCRGRKWLDCSVRIEINSVLVSGHRNRRDIKVGIENDMISVMAYNLTWFLCSGSKLTRF